MKSVHIVAVPYDSGHRNERMGTGPFRILDDGLADSLREAGHPVAVETVEAASGFRTEVTTAFDLMRNVSVAVSAAVRRDEFPLILSGNCSIAVGTVSGLQQEQENDCGIVWFDAHGDLESPETTTSGFFDGTGLSILAGRCWSALASSVPSFQAIPASRILLAGSNDLSNAEKESCSTAGINLLEGDTLAHDPAGFDRAIENLYANGVRRVYLHVDLDVLHKDFAPVNSYQADAGITPDILMDCIARLGKKLKISACALSAYDSGSDPDGATVTIAKKLARQILEFA